MKWQVDDRIADLGPSHREKLHRSYSPTAQCTVYSLLQEVIVGLLVACKTLATIEFIHAIRVLPIGWALIDGTLCIVQVQPAESAD